MTDFESRLRKFWLCQGDHRSTCELNDALSVEIGSNQLRTLVRQTSIPATEEA